MFDWGDSNRDLLSMLSTRVRHQYFSNRGVIVFFIIEPFQTMDPTSNDLHNFIQMIERNPRYNNIIFLYGRLLQTSVLGPGVFLNDMWAFWACVKP